MSGNQINKRVLISPSSFGECGDKPLTLLHEHHIDFIINPYGRRMTEKEVVSLAADCEGILAGVETLSAEVLDQLPNLKCISRVGSGMQNVDLEAARARGVIVKNTPEGPTLAVAELTVGLAFSLIRKIPQADRNIRRGVWQKEMGSLLSEQRIGIVGLGKIGRKTAEMFLAMGCNVIGNDPKPDDRWLELHPVAMFPLEELLSESDIVTLHLDHQAESPPIIGAQELSMMKSSAYLLNLSRGGAVDEDALFDTLSQGRIAGAALDVFSNEPYSGPLQSLDNIILTPHLGSYAREARVEMETEAVRNLLHGLGVEQ